MALILAKVFLTLAALLFGWALLDGVKPAKPRPTPEHITPEHITAVMTDLTDQKTFGYSNQPQWRTPR